MNDINDSKMAHEAFVTGLRGSLALDVILAVLPVVPTSFVAFTITGGNIGLLNFLIEFSLCCLPLILTFTVFNGYTLEISAASLLLAMLAMTYIKSAGASHLPSNKTAHSPILTCCRATVNLATIIAIFAVDFHCFPRRYAKTEEYGYSLMDVGAPCFILMNGITDRKRQDGLRSVIRDAVVLSSLGVVRLISLHATNYHQHVTEYGVHGNFFFTLAFLKILCLLGFTKLKGWQLLVLSLCLIVIHQWFILDEFSNWILSQSPRNDFFSANRESIFSLPGYLVLYLLGMAFGNIFMLRKFAQPQRSYLLPLLVCAAFMTVGILQQKFGLTPSRRLMNLPFVAWIVAFFSLFLLWFQMVSEVAGRSFVPGIFTAINRQGLLFFLSANLLTGLVNLTVDTLFILFPLNLLMIIGYSFVIVGSVYSLLIFNRK